MKKTTKTTKKSATPTPIANAAATTTISTAPILAKPAVITAASAVPATVKSAPTPVPAKSSVVTTVAPVTIEAKIDVGFGNKLFVRGAGEGLSWERGIPLENVDSKTWRLTVPAKDKVQFKLLLNDSVWAQGEDLVAAPGKKVEVTPAF
jgi:hypothetical protein